MNNAGIEGVNNEAFDLKITVPTTMTTYSSLLDLAYNTPSSAITSQGALTTGGFVCLSNGLRVATCPAGGQPDFYTANCPTVDGETITVMKGV